MRKLLIIAYLLGLTLYNYYLKRMSENLITSSPQLIHGILYRESLQYYLERPIGDKYAVRMIDVHGQGLGRSSVGKRFRAIVISDPSVTPPKGFVAFCCQLEEIQNET